MTEAVNPIVFQSHRPSARQGGGANGITHRAFVVAREAQGAVRFAVLRLPISAFDARRRVDVSYVAVDVSASRSRLRLPSGTPSTLDVSDVTVDVLGVAVDAAVVVDTALRSMFRLSRSASRCRSSWSTDSNVDDSNVVVDVSYVAVDVFGCRGRRLGVAVDVSVPRSALRLPSRIPRPYKPLVRRG